MDHTLHSVWVNSKAYEVAGITKDTPNPAGGEYVKNEDGQLSGSVKGGPAHLPILVKTEAITTDAIMTALPDLLEGMSEFGFTSAIDMGMPFAAEAAFGAFVELGSGVDGLLHITDMSFGRIQHPSELFKVNDEVEVIVLKFDPETERVSLGYKQLHADVCRAANALARQAAGAAEQLDDFLQEIHLP